MLGDLLEVPFKVFRWNPRKGDVAPFAVWIFISGVLQLSRLGGPVAPAVLEWMRPMADLAYLILPLMWIRLFSKESLSYLGVTSRRWGWALGLGIPLGLLTGWLVLSRSLSAGEVPFLPSWLQTAAYLLGALYHLAAIEFFYRGWLAARLERSYGFLVAVVVSSLLYALSPLVLWGTDPTVPAAFSSVGFYWNAVFPFTFFMGILLAGLGRLTRSLITPILIMLPQTIIGDLLPGGAAHEISDPLSKMVGTIALAGIVAVVLWLTRRRKKP